jgi:hypothetical protein
MAMSKCSVHDPNVASSLVFNRPDASGKFIPSWSGIRDSALGRLELLADTERTANVTMGYATVCHPRKGGKRKSKSIERAIAPRAAVRQDLISAELGL